MMAFDWRGFWGRRGVAQGLLLPLAAVFAVVVLVRRFFYRCLPPRRVGGAAVVVVGSVVVGGAGKTPFVIALVIALQRAGFKVGVVSRGYGRQGSNNSAAEMVQTDAAGAARRFGDEPLLIARKTGAAVCVGARRALAVAHLQAQVSDVDVVVSDDGLQHYAMHRDVEVGLINGRYGSGDNAGFGNGWLLPAGALREPRSRLKECAVRVVLNGELSKFPLAHVAVDEEVEGFYFLSDSQQRIAADAFASDVKNKRVAAVCGLAHPQAFFARLRSLGIALASTHALPDHARMSDADLRGIAADIILMTEKDAVKYAEGSGGDARICVMAIRYTLPDALITTITKHLQNTQDSQHSHGR